MAQVKGSNDDAMCKIEIVRVIKGKDKRLYLYHV